MKILKCDLCDNPVEYEVTVSEATNKVTKQTVELCVEHMAEFKKVMRKFMELTQKDE